MRGPFRPNPLRIPELENPPPRANKLPVLREPRLLPAVGRKQNASRAIEFGFPRARDPEAADTTQTLVELRLFVERANDALPHRDRGHVEALILGHHEQVAVGLRERIPVSRRYAHPALRVDRVLVAPNKHF